MEYVNLSKLSKSHHSYHRWISDSKVCDSDQKLKTTINNNNYKKAKISLIKPVYGYHQS